ncbi:heptaprenyl diphosphate synthase [Priestia megaterium]|nr:heptaprenyl diphosphate synthase [Priestia megaterium]
MMNVQNIYDILTNMKEQIHVELSHPYVKKFIQHPTIDENKLLYICSFLATLSLEKQKLNRCALSVMLVQTALDTHDLVSTQNVRSDDEQLHERQLTVLAGDYYSGLYYYYLAQTGQLDLIKAIASAIKEINIAKIHIYNKQSNDVHDIITNFLVAETSLVRCLCNYFEREEWKELVEHASNLNGILKQLDALKLNHSSLLLDYFKKIGMKDEQISELLYSYTHDSVTAIKRYLKSGLEINELLRNHLFELTSSLERLENVVGEG